MRVSLSYTQWFTHFLYQSLWVQWGPPASSRITQCVLKSSLQVQHLWIETRWSPRNVSQLITCYLGRVQPILSLGRFQLGLSLSSSLSLFLNWSMRKTRVQSLGREDLRRKWQPTPVFLPGKSHGQRNLVGYSPWGCKESDMTEQLHSLTVDLRCCLSFRCTANKQAS